MAQLSTMALSPIAAGAGGELGLQSLDPRLLNRLLTFPGETIVIDQLTYRLRLRFAQNGYQVFDTDKQFIYSVRYDPSQQAIYDSQGPDAVLPDCNFGFHPKDAIFMAAQNRGTAFYLQWTQVQAGQTNQRCIFVLISPVDGVTIQLPQNTNRSNVLRL